MKRNIFLLLLGMAMPLSTMAQDDLYFTPKKEVKEAKPTRAPQQRVTTPYSYYSGSNRDVDEYNRRHGAVGSHYQVIDADSTASDVIAFHAGDGLYPDSTYIDTLFVERPYDMSQYDEDDDYTYSRRLYSFYGYYDPWLYGRWGWNPYWRPGWYDPWYYGYAGWWYDPWYYGYYGWYDPWYYGYGWPYHGGWYGGWYGGYAWHPVHSGGHVHTNVAGNLSNRTFGGSRNSYGTTWASHGARVSQYGSRSGGNGGSNTRGTLSRNNTRTFGKSSSYGANRSTFSGASTRSGSFSGGTRSGGFSGGGGGGGFSGGGSRGGGGGGHFGGHR